MSPQPLCDSVLSKIREQIDTAARLIGLLPAGRLDWAPPYPGAWPVHALLAHLLECCAGFCAVLHAVEPERLAHFTGLRTLARHHIHSPADALNGLAIFRAHIDEGFALLVDSRLAAPVPTIFVKDGEPLLTLLLGNLEHLINHKHQFFTYLKEMGVDVGTPDLYRLRGGA